MSEPDDQPRSGGRDTLWRQPWAILAALGLLSLLSHIVALPQDLLILIEQFQAILRPATQFLFGWFLGLFATEIPTWLWDYFTMGLITAACSFRVLVLLGTSGDQKLTVGVGVLVGLILFVAWLLWPLFTFSMTRAAFSSKTDAQMAPLLRVYFEAFLWAAAILIVAYGLALGGVQMTSPTVPAAG